MAKGGYRKEYFVNCVGVGCLWRGSVFLADACVWGGRFQSLWIAKGAGKRFDL